MAKTRPNFLIIVADDLGFSDVSCFGSEIQTPNIDSLSKDGIRFTDFHTASACSPTRSMLLSGTDHHLTGLGQMVECLMDSPVHQGKPGHEGYLIDSIATLPEVLRNGGYHTMMSGKWHLGLKPEHSPVARGFNRSFSLLPPAANHYAWDPEIENDANEPRFGQLNVAALHIEDGTYVDNSNLPSDFYSSDYYVSKALEYMDERPKERPFFMYLPFSAPHWPLQAPVESVEHYHGKYSDGPDALRLRRLEALIALGIVPKDVIPHPVIAPEVPEWDNMTDTQRAKSARSMEVYAGMVDRMDFNIGRVLLYLKQQGLYDNTEIIFMSDNGAEGYSYEAAPLTGGKTLAYVERYFDNSLDNIGKKDSFVWYGGRWAQAATAPSRLYKKFSTEGGVRVPFVLKPVRSPSLQSICHHFCTVMDIMPTILEQAGVEKPGNVYGGRQVQPIRGASWVPFLTEQSSRPHHEDYVAGWELFGQAALRKGPWKLNWVNQPFGSESWQLFDLVEDPGETNDLSAAEEGKVKELLAHWEEYACETGVVGLTSELKALAAQDDMENPCNWMTYETSRSVTKRLKEQRTTLKDSIQ